MEQAAIYVRSSKDRSAISIEAQQRELKALAKTNKLAIVETFQDVVESGKDDRRPGFQALLRRLKDPARAWTFLLALDTSRIARNQYLAHALHYECEKRGIKVLYAKVPETGSAMDVVIRAVMQSFDQLHSLMSREKGLSGMAENVKRGWRAGGRAPVGYKLEHVDTGAVRDGAPVTKSRLVPGPEAAKLGSYLKDRAAGVSRYVAAERAGLALTASSLVGIEWNALTYAGHTVWNVHNERIDGTGYKGGTKRRPRSEWVIQHDTHKAFISTEEAEAIIARLDSRPQRKRKRKTAEYLLSGLLVTPDGRMWYGQGDGNYRAGKGRRVSREKLESAVVEKIADDLMSSTFVAELTREGRRMSDEAASVAGDAKSLRLKVNALAVKAERLAVLAAESETPRPFLDQIKRIEAEREELSEKLDALEAQEKHATVLGALSEREVRELLSGLAEHFQAADRDALKDMIAGMVEKIELDPADLTARIHYRIEWGSKRASPRVSEFRPPLKIISLLAA